MKKEILYVGIFIAILVLSVFAQDYFTVTYTAYARQRRVVDSSLVRVKPYPHTSWQKLVDVGARIEAAFNADQDTSEFYVDWLFERTIQHFDSTGSPTTSQRQNRSSKFNEKVKLRIELESGIDD